MLSILSNIEIEELLEIHDTFSWIMGSTSGVTELEPAFFSTVMLR